MVRLLVGAFAVALLSTAIVAAEEKKKDKPATPVWEREVNGVELKLEVGTDVLKISGFSGDNGITVTCKSSIDKDGVVKAKVTDVVEKGNFPAKPPKGLEFSFKWKVKGDTATVSDLKGEGLEDARAAIEGDYKKKK